jgi:hypothetical protein
MEKLSERHMLVSGILTGFAGTLQCLQAAEEMEY